jgi:hypothetical protein
MIATVTAELPSVDQAHVPLEAVSRGARRIGLAVHDVRRVGLRRGERRVEREDLIGLHFGNASDRRERGRVAHAVHHGDAGALVQELDGAAERGDASGEVGGEAAAIR